MAKSKKSKILAMALCASVMTGIYASPVMAADASFDSISGNIVFTIAGDTCKINKDDITKAIEKNHIHSNGRISANAGFIANGGSYYAIRGTNNEYTMLANEKYFALGSGGLLKGAVGTSNYTVTKEKATFYVDNGTGNVTTKGTLSAANGAFTVDKDGNVTSKLINDVDVKAVEGTVDGLTVDVDNLTADTSRLSANVNDLSADTKRLTGNVEDLKTDTQNIRADIGNLKTDIGNNNADISGLKDKTQGIDHWADNTTYYNGAISATGSVMAGGMGNEAIIGGNTTDGGYLSLKDANDEYQTLTAAKLGTINNVITDDGAVVSQGDVTSTDGTNTYHLNTVGANTAGIRHTQSGATNVTVIEENLKVYDDGTIVGAKENFKVTADGTVISDKLNVGNGNFTVSDGGIGAFGSQFTVNTNGEISTTGINVAEGMFTASDGGVTMAKNKLSVDLNGNIKAGTYNGVKIGMTEAGDITLGDDIVIDDKFNSDNVAGITRDPLADSAPGGSNTTYIEQNTAISADGIVVTDPGSGVSTKTKYDGFYVKDKNSNIVSSLKDDGLMLTDQESGETHTLNATDIADIKGIDREGAGDPGNGTTTIEGATSFTKDGMVTSNITTDNITTDSFTAGVTVDSSYGINEDGEMLFRSGGNYIGMDRKRIGFTSGTESVTINGDGTTFTSRDSTTRTTTSTVIKGGTITTDTLKVKNIVLGNSMTDEVGNSIALGANGTLKVNNEKYSLNLDKTGFNLSNASNTSSFSLGEFGFTFSGPVNLGAGDKVGFTHTGSGKYITLDGLVDRVEDLEQKTTGISFDENTGNTTIKDMNKGTDGKWTAGDSSVTVGDNGTTFENGEGNGTTNINGGAIDADSSSIGNDVSGGSGSGSSGMTGNGTYTDGSKHSGQFADGDNSYKFTNNAYGFTGTVTDGEHTTTIENGAKGSNTTVTGEGNTSASSGVGIGNDDAFISDSVTNGDISHTVNGGDITNTVTGGTITDTVTNGDMTVTEVKDENGSATTVEYANSNSTVSKSTVSQNTNGQTVSTGTGTSVNTGNDFVVTDTEGKSIYMSDIGHVEDIDSEIQNSDGSKTTVVDAVNNEAEIRRNEIERVDGRINNLENRVGKLEDRVDKVGAMAAAIANLRTMGYDPAAPTEVAVGIGQYRDETGAALGLFHYPNRDFMLSLSVSTSGDEVMGGIGATWKFGRKSPEKVAEIKKAQAEADARRAEEAKLAKAEEMKQAAKEAKIKAQQERHAKLAAQAEAAK